MKDRRPGSSSIRLRSQWTWTSTVRVSPRVVVAPDVLEELVAGEDLARVADEERQELERLRLDRDDLAVAQEAMAGEVDLDLAEVDRRPARRRRRRPGRDRRKSARIRAVSSRRLNGLVT